MIALICLGIIVSGILFLVELIDSQINKRPIKTFANVCGFITFALIVWLSAAANYPYQKRVSYYPLYINENKVMAVVNNKIIDVSEIAERQINIESEVLKVVDFSRTSLGIYLDFTPDYFVIDKKDAR